jgi:hypothetical protein
LDPPKAPRNLHRHGNQRADTTDAACRQLLTAGVAFFDGTLFSDDELIVAGFEVGYDGMEVLL